MIGLKFKIHNEYGNVLSKILDNMNFSNYKWIIAEEEVLGIKGQEFFEKQEYENDEFQEVIQKEYYPIFLNLQMFYQNKEPVIINNYHQYSKSSCELVLLIIDSIFVDIYVKNQDILRKIHENVVKYHYTNIEYMKDNKEMDKLLSL